MTMLIHTIKGDLPEGELVKSIIEQDYEDAKVTATEYHYGDELVRRDVEVALKPKALEIHQQGF